MTEELGQFVHRILESPIWEQFRLMQAEAPTSGNIFSFSEYLAALALLLVVMIASDFRFRYRLLLARMDLKKVGFWVGLIVGAAILFIDLWFQNGLPIPTFMANANNLKAVVGLIFLAFVFWVISVAVVRPPVFNKANAKKFFEANHHFIHEGNAERLQIIAEELRRSLRAIVNIATKIPVVGHDRGLEKMPKEVVYAHYILLLFADRRFCRIVVDKIPTFPLALINESKRHRNARIPLFPFVRNIGQEFIQNKESSLYQEQSVYQSGLFGLERPVTSILFGSYAFVEKCAREGESPSEIEYRDLIEFDEVQIEGFTRAALAFLESYLKETKGLSDSQALVRMLNSIESSFTRAYEMDGLEDFRNTKAYGHLDAAAKFIEEAVRLVAQHADKPRTFRTSGELSIGIFDQLARLIVEAIFAASMVSSPVWTSWIVQHNTVWVHVFGHVESAADRIIAFKVRRLLYDEIRELDQFAGFRGARLLGFCLNVLGLQLTDRHRGFRREFYPLQAASVGWIKANYKNLLAEHPEVAEACLQGSISYESDNHRLVKTYSDRTGKQPQREFLYLD